MDLRNVVCLVDSRLPKALPDVQFDVYGTGDRFDRLKAESADMPNPRLHGFVPDVERRLAESDVLLHLCPEEPFGLVILEAFRVGLVVIGPSSGSAGQLIEEGVTGLRFKPNDTEDLLRVLRQVQAMSGTELERIADAGQRRLNERFSQAEGARRYREALAAAGMMKRTGLAPRAPQLRSIDSLLPTAATTPATPDTPAHERMQILCIMRMPPDPNGHGGSQRAWRLLQALLQHGTVHFVLIYREQDRDCMQASLDPIMPLVASANGSAFRPGAHEPPALRHRARAGLGLVLDEEPGRTTTARGRLAVDRRRLATPPFRRRVRGPAVLRDRRPIAARAQAPVDRAAGGRLRRHHVEVRDAPAAQPPRSGDLPLGDDADRLAAARALREPHRRRMACRERLHR